MERGWRGKGRGGARERPRGEGEVKRVKQMGAEEGEKDGQRRFDLGSTFEGRGEADSHGGTEERVRLCVLIILMMMMIRKTTKE